MFSILKSDRRKTRSQKSRAFRFESLERRDLMAGNVVAKVIGGNLIITGDGAANGVTVQRADASTYQVSGLLTAGGDTRINDKVNFPAVLKGVTNEIQAYLNGGNDVINFHGSGAAAPLTSPKNFFVYTHDGNDEVNMYDVKAGGDMVVNMGAGVDRFTGVTVTTGNNLHVQESSSTFKPGDSDLVNIYNNSKIGGQLNVQFNRGNDSFKTDRTTFGSIWMTAGSGNDSIVVSQATVKTYINIDPGLGSDATTVEYSNVGDDLIVTEATGSRPTTDLDHVTIGANKVADYVSVQGNRGREKVWITGNTAGRLYASLGEGDDWLNIKKTTVKSTWTLLGGGGNDSLNRSGNNKNLTASGFESYTAYDWL